MNTGVRRILDYRPGSRMVRNGSVRVAAAAVVAVGALVGLKKWEREKGTPSPHPPNSDRGLGETVPENDLRWGPGVEDLEQIASRGEEIYGRLAKKLESEFPNQCVFINVDNGEYVLGGTFGEAHKKFVSRFGSAPSWDTRIGEHPHVFHRTRVLQ